MDNKIPHFILSYVFVSKHWSICRRLKLKTSCCCLQSVHWLFYHAWRTLYSFELLFHSTYTQFFHLFIRVIDIWSRWNVLHEMNPFNIFDFDVNTHLPPARMYHNDDETQRKFHLNSIVVVALASILIGNNEMTREVICQGCKCMRSFMFAFVSNRYKYNTCSICISII